MTNFLLARTRILRLFHSQRTACIYFCVGSFRNQVRFSLEVCKTFETGYPSQSILTANIQTPSHLSSFFSPSLFLFQPLEPFLTLSLKCLNSSYFYLARCKRSNTVNSVELVNEKLSRIKSHR